MSLQPPDHGFFVGYFKKIPPAIRRFNLLFAALFVSGLFLTALGLALGTRDPGPGRFVDDLEGNFLTGLLEESPYPLLRTLPTEGKPARAIMLASSNGKRGISGEHRLLAGDFVDAKGIFVKRGALDMLLLGGPKGGIEKAHLTEAPQNFPSPPIPLGRYRLTGEICDGKCYAGAMRPGRGLAHKACANLCLQGGIPPVFVSTAPVAGATFLLLGNKDGRPLPEGVFTHTAALIEVEGHIERRDDLLLFLIDPATIRTPRR